MKVVRVVDNTGVHYQATGKGPVRMIVIEASDRLTAMEAFHMAAYRQSQEDKI